ncbi:N-glycosylase/DNA lyase [Mycobacteroides abscessus]|uniref:N-glycosylase/DNA lyase n=1 Tax=Mycobacteroides abscessus TaxID=36809 RepID=A0A0U0ZR19_9MYCO|nr:N-glycosylase/DNA lyase [Mycobacteroides abscessus]
MWALATETSVDPQYGRDRLSHPGPLVTLSPNGYEPRTLRWGQMWQIGTAAFWVAITAEEHAGVPTAYGLGRGLAEEVAACLLGGYGMPAEVGLAAFYAVRDRGLLRQAPSAADIEQVLRQPLNVGERQVRYRFPAQRATYLAAALARIASEPAPHTAHELRAWLQTMPGIGPKTSGWIVRNHLSSDEVAIIDIHIQRAGIAAGVFDPTWTATRNYAPMEAFFLDWARHGDVHARDLDSTIWEASVKLARWKMRRNSAR